VVVVDDDSAESLLDPHALNSMASTTSTASGRFMVSTLRNPSPWCAIETSRTRG